MCDFVDRGEGGTMAPLMGEHNGERTAVRGEQARRSRG